MPLSDAACRAAKPGATLRKLSDGGGLQLWVQPNGSRLGRLAYRFQGKQKLLSLGAYPLFTLLEAREARDRARRQLAVGIDPSKAKKEQKAAQNAPCDAFKAVATEYVEKLKREGRAPATIKKKEWLLALAFPTLGSTRVSELRPIDTLRVLQEVEIRCRLPLRDCHRAGRDRSNIRAARRVDDTCRQAAGRYH
jgi:Arm DNA-binding domain